VKEETHGVEGWKKEGKLTCRLKKTGAKKSEENKIKETHLGIKGPSHKTSTYNINGIIFKLAEVKPGRYEGR
jgi:hypothetical protein